MVYQYSRSQVIIFSQWMNVYANCHREEEKRSDRRGKEEI